MMADLEVNDLTVEYTSGDYVIKPIDSLSFQASSGELVILLGPSGSGKTSLLSCLAGILTPASGTITFGDTEVTALTGPALTAYRRGVVGIVFQTFNLIPSLSAEENVAVPLRSQGTERGEARARASRILTTVGLEDRAHHRPGDLSGGQQQRVAIARALAHDPALLLADEPTAHLDYIQVDGVVRIIRDLARPGRLVVIATHDERIVPLADKVVELAARFTAPAAGAQPRALETGEVLFDQGATGDLIYVVEEGEVDLIRIRADGTEENLGTVGQGDYFGELAPLLGFRRAATARARVPARVVGYTVREFRDLMGDKWFASIVKTHSAG
jgi:putative ABC transport system ATP-binding protein